MLDAFDHEYIPEHLLTQEFLQEVKSLLAPGGVLAANTFSSSRLYEHESSTYATVFPQFFNLKRENRVIIARLRRRCRTRRSCGRTAQQFDDSFDALRLQTRQSCCRCSRSERDWDPRARVLTDQYSPANLLNLGALTQSARAACARARSSARLTSCSCGRSPPVMFSSCAVESSSASFFHDSRMLALLFACRGPRRSRRPSGSA